jgi:transcriptional regulator with XRE-family HTH domain
LPNLFSSIIVPTVTSPVMTSGADDAALFPLPAQLRIVPADGHGPDGARDLAGALRAFRRGRGLTVRQAGNLVGGSHWVWAQWEDGVRPSPVYLHRIASLLGLSVEQARSLAGPDRVRRAASVGEDYSHPLAQARVAAGLSSAEFARRLHVSASLVSRWEAGERIPSRRYWPQIASVLGLGSEQLEQTYRDRPAPSDVAFVPSLRAIRVRRGRTQVDIAHALGVDVTSVQRWEQFGRAPYRQAQRLAHVLCVDLETLGRPSVARPPSAPVASPLRRLRRSRNFTACLVAARAGESPAVLLSWERGANRPSWAQARALARALAAPIEEVFAAVGMASPRHLDPSRWKAEDLPAILRELRMWQGWTQGQLAELLGVGSATVRAWERGRQRPRRKPLERLDLRLDVTPRLADLLYPRHE